uniref:Fibrinogen C-terminal domain-containing protein n=1 Tax=Haptolina ericina TaxID=156174 RepID=A0A7S3BSL9_9EUKA
MVVGKQVSGGSGSTGGDGGSIIASLSPASPPPASPPPASPPPAFPPPVHADCRELYDGGEKRDGLYTVTPSGASAAIDTFCDMTRNGGGWSLVANTRDTTKTCTSIAYGTLASKSQSEAWRLSDGQIQQLQGSGGGLLAFERSDGSFIFFKYRADYNNRLFDSTAGQTSAIRECRGGDLSGVFTHTQEPSTTYLSGHQGLDTYQVSPEKINCGTWLTWCYNNPTAIAWISNAQQIRLRIDNSSPMTYDGRLWVRAGVG